MASEIFILEEIAFSGVTFNIVFLFGGLFFFLRVFDGFFLLIFFDIYYLKVARKGCSEVISGC